MKLDCQVKSGVSKAGKEYIYLSVMINGYEKKVFLESAEEQLLALLVKNQNPQK